MKIRNVHSIEKKPLAEYCCGECFIFHDRVTEDNVLMMVVGEKNRANNSNLVKVVNMDTCEIEEMLDFYIYTQVTADIENIGNIGA